MVVSQALEHVIIIIIIVYLPASWLQRMRAHHQAGSHQSVSVALPDDPQAPPRRT